VSVRTSLAAVLQSHGADVLDRPMELRAALRASDSPTNLSEGEVDLISRVAAAGGVQVLRAALGEGVPEAGAVDRASATVTKAIDDVPAPQVRDAIAELAVALRGQPLVERPRVAQPPQQPVVQQPVLQQPDQVPSGTAPAGATPAGLAPPEPTSTDAAEPAEPTGPVSSVPGSAPANEDRSAPAAWLRNHRRGSMLAAAVGVVVLAVLATVAIVALRNDDPTDRNDRTDRKQTDALSLETVEQRYAALGTWIVEGASSCERAQPATGETDAVRCSFGTWDLELATVQDDAALEASRAPLRVDPGRGARYQIREAGAYFYAESVPQDGPKTLYWDAGSPALVRARVVTDVRMAELETWWDQRGFDPSFVRPTLLPLGPTDWFVSEPLRGFASRYFGVQGLECHEVEVAAGHVDEVACADEHGRSYLFWQAADEPTFVAERETFRSGERASAETTELWYWYPGTDESDRRGDKIIFVADETGLASIYVDEVATLSAVLIHGAAGDSVGNLDAFWETPS
jgi:hypothetical protein